MVLVENFINEQQTFFGALKQPDLEAVSPWQMVGRHSILGGESHVSGHHVDINIFTDNHD